jgi:ataxia telangiectasia mutated family protein
VGLVEWVLKTSPLYEVLVDARRGVHPRYRSDKKQLTFMETFKIAKESHYSGYKDSDGRLQSYLELCEAFPPAFRHFFTESFQSPVDWFASKLSYSRSVAVNSIVGYIVGLGDRHNNNILLDKSTAELVHIDLGVAFDVGKVLKTPEVVPFRLTRDIVDGLGVTGVEGVFRRCCEETMRVLRANSEQILTLLEVFLHDPLYVSFLCSLSHFASLLALPSFFLSYCSSSA